MSDMADFKSIGAQNFLYPCPIIMVGSYIDFENNQVNQESRKANIMTVAWASMCSAQPPALLVAVRSSRCTHGAILKHRAFTVNIPDSSMLAEVDYAGIFSGAHENKIKQCNFTVQAAEHVDAPYICECPVVIELKLIEHHDIGTHTIFIGEIMDTKIKENLLDDNGVPSPKLLDIACYIPLLKEYWSIGDFKAKAFSVGKTLNVK